MSLEAVPREVLVCQSDDGSEPFNEWLDGLDLRTQALVLKRLQRIQNGNFGDVSSVGDGVSELRFDLGPGYRVYFGQTGTKVHLINGGTKKRQQRDVDAAKEFWREYAWEK